MTVQADGKIVVGGSFTTLAGRVRNHIGRLNGDGTLDGGEEIQVFVNANGQHGRHRKCHDGGHRDNRVQFLCRHNPALRIGAGVEPLKASSDGFPSRVEIVYQSPLCLVLFSACTALQPPISDS